MIKFYNKNDPLYKTGERFGFLIGLLIFSSIVFYIVNKIGWNNYEIRYYQFIFTILALFVIYTLIRGIFK